MKELLNEIAERYNDTKSVLGNQLAATYRADVGALLSHIETLKAQDGWLEIDDKCKDGKKYLLYGESKGGRHNFDVDRWHNGKGMMSYTGFYIAKYFTPTHYRLLPTPPVVKGGICK